jgi:hypothetical protein
MHLGVYLFVLFLLPLLYFIFFYIHGYTSVCVERILICLVKPNVSYMFFKPSLKISTTLTYVNLFTTQTLIFGLLLAQQQDIVTSNKSKSVRY